MDSRYWHFLNKGPSSPADLYDNSCFQRETCACRQGSHIANFCSRWLGSLVLLGLESADVISLVSLV